jgi:hypothetical protein
MLRKRARVVQSRVEPNEAVDDVSITEPNKRSQSLGGEVPSVDPSQSRSGLLES